MRNLPSPGTPRPSKETGEFCQSTSGNSNRNLPESNNTIAPTGESLVQTVLRSRRRTAFSKELLKKNRELKALVYTGVITESERKEELAFHQGYFDPGGRLHALRKNKNPETIFRINRMLSRIDRIQSRIDTLLLSLRGGCREETE